MYSKNVAIAQITDPAEVEQECNTRGWIYDKGAIFVTIPEIGFEGSDMIYCRYGLSMPYIRIQKNWKLLVEPTIEGDNRWFYTGIVDCGGSITPDTDMQMLLQFLEQVIYAKSDNTLHLSSKTAEEPLVLGNKLQTWIESFIDIFNKHTHGFISGAPSSAGITNVPGTAGTGTLSPVPLPSNPDDLLSEKVFTE